MHIFEPGLEPLVKRNLAGGAAALHRRPEGGDGARPVHLQLRRHPAHGRRRLRPVPDSGGRPPDRGRARPSTRSSSTSPPSRSVRPTRCTASLPSGCGPAGLGARVRRRLQPRVPEGGRRGQRLHEARPHHRGHRQRAHGQAPRDALRPVRPQPRQDDRHGRAQRGDDQVRRQLHAGDQDFLHQRDRQHLRAGGGERRLGAARDRRRPPHRLPLHLPRRRATGGRASPRTSRR